MTTTEVPLIGNDDSLSSSSAPTYGDVRENDGGVTYAKVVVDINWIATPIIISVGLTMAHGLTGNAVGSATFLRVAGLRSRGIGHLLVAICVNDAIFLASLPPTWIGRHYGRDYFLYSRNRWACRLLSFTAMSSNFLTTWLTVALGVERYICHSGPR